MVVSKEELLKRVQELGLDNTSDVVITLLEDIFDTMDANTDEEKTRQIETLTMERDTAITERDNIDKEWREKYVARFMGGDNFDETQIIETPNINDIDDESNIETITIDDLFKED